MTTPTPSAVGAYGLRLSGVDGLEGQLVLAPESWIPLELILRSGTTETDQGWIASRRANYVMPSGGSIQLDLDRAQAIVTAPSTPSVEEIIHPYLAAVGALMGYMNGEESFHAAAVAADGGAWAIVGDRHAGKSSTLASLATLGFPVVCDDMLVMRGTTALAGPRSVDLRRDAASRLALGEELGIVGTRERWRVQVGPVDPELELRGWIFLEWGDEVDLSPLPVPDRLARLLPMRGVLLPPPEAAALLDLAHLPGLLLRRPHDWVRLPEAVTAIAEMIDKDA